MKARKNVVMLMLTDRSGCTVVMVEEKSVPQIALAINDDNLSLEDTYKAVEDVIFETDKATLKSEVVDRVFYMAGNCATESTEFLTDYNIIGMIYLNV